ncbi:MAG: PIN domain-containing protein, partial [Candidatus Micrarchaeota archaeon]
MGRLFLDTNIYLGALREEKAQANLLFERALSCEFEIIYCELIESEIYRKYPDLAGCLADQLEKLLKKKKLIYTEISPNERREAIRLMKILKTNGINIGYEDCIFGVKARNSGSILVSEDKMMV